MKRVERWLRLIVQDALLVPLVRAFCAPFRARGAVRESEPLVIVANHTSHLDAPAILAALPPHARHRTAIAAADDYFYRQPLLGLALSLGIGAFPFPRQGSLGLDRAADLLAHGWNVLIFPEGTRSADGALHEFRYGVGRLVARTRAPV
ncbi:MAG TPA: lysophospholipid acyltransferase family protein, partial [Chloroflexota bacterium]|nr:lysophospholipid acyltransferase family protein [Chloroflexota bacterium]